MKLKPGLAAFCAIRPGNSSQDLHSELLITKTIPRSGYLQHMTCWGCFTSPPTQYRLYGRRFLQVKRPNQQYQSTEGTNSTQTNQTYNKHTWTHNTANPLVYTNMRWLGDGSHRWQSCQARTAVGLPPRYPKRPRQQQIDTWCSMQRAVTPHSSAVRWGKP